MIQYGVSIQDRRYQFITYDTYLRKPIIAKDCLLIVDEAHNMRTDMELSTAVDPVSLKPIEGYFAKQNKRGFRIWENGALHAHKILLLTGTMFVNTIQDAENLLAMIDQRTPLSRDLFTTVLSSPSNIVGHFSHRISYYTSPKSDLFPDVRYEMPIYMTKIMEKEYYRLKQEGIPTKKTRGKKDDEVEGSGGENAFFCAERHASNMIKNENGINPNIQ